jgi:transposase
LDGYIQAAKTVEISNYLIDRNNSSFVEGFNIKVKVLKRSCYGLANSVRLFQRIILDTLGLERLAPCVVAY